MNDLRSPTTTRWSDDHMDDLLRGFFRAEMPDPWPVMTAPASSTITRVPIRPVVPPRRRWFQLGVRLALAASIGFILVAYLALARNFPQVNQGPPGLSRETRDISQKQPRRVKTPRGREAFMWEDAPADDRIIIKLEMINPPRGQR